MFIAFVGFQFSSPFLPLYVRELGVTDPAMIALWSGVLAAVTPTVSGLLSPVFGRLADRFGRKMMLIRSLAAFTVIIALMGLVTSVWQFFAMRFLQGASLRNAYLLNAALALGGAALLVFGARDLLDHRERFEG